MLSPSDMLNRLMAAWKREHPCEVLPLPSDGVSRRRFLAILGSSAAVVAAAPLVDVERLLWVPGHTIVVPEMPLVRGVNSFITPDWVTRDVMQMFKNNLTLAGRFNRQWDEAGQKAGEIIHIPRARTRFA